MNFSNISYVSPPSCNPRYSLSALTLSFLVILMSLVGNGFIVHIIRRTKALHTFTNYLLAQKSILDIFISIITPSQLFQYFYPRPKFTQVASLLNNLPLLVITLIYSNCFTVVLISVDRFLAVVFPLIRAKKFRTVKLTFILMWTTAVTGSLLFVLLHSKLHQILFYALLVVPIIITGVCYAAVCVKLLRRKLPGNSSAQNQEASERKTRKVITVLIIMTASFYITWSPVYSGVYEENRCISIIIYYFLSIDGVFMPWVYVTVIEQYRNGFKKIFRRKVESDNSIKVEDDKNQETKLHEDTEL